MSDSNSIPSDRTSIFKECQIYILPMGLGKKRLSLFEMQITNHGGTVCKPKNECLLATHIIVEDLLIQDSEKLTASLNKLNVSRCPTVKIVGTQWLSKSLKENQCVDTTEFEMHLPEKKNLNKLSVYEPVAVQIQAHEVFSIDAPSSSEKLQPTPYVVQYSPPKKLKIDVVEKFVCSHSSNTSSTVYNQVITNELQKLANAFRNSGDQWRAHGYEKAISAIKAYSKEIKSFEEAAAIPGIGQKMAAKVLEVLECGKLRKVDEICNSEKVKVIELFTNVWGAGPSTAEGWYLQGFRTLDDLKTKAKLTKQQKIGLKHYDDIQDRIPRQEVEHIGRVVCDAAVAIEPSLTVMVCGSYRRGKATCGDIDILISKSPKVSGDILSRLLAHLKETGFITDDLVSLEDNGFQKKYLGLCRLPGENQRHRRLDIFVVPQAEFAPAIMHYTGSALFNRSIRLLAAKKGMSLSEHSLLAGIVRQGRDMVSGGYVIPTPTEESIFQHLGIPYRPPEERDHVV